jgi:hypothetical protein
MGTCKYFLFDDNDGECRSEETTDGCVGNMISSTYYNFYEINEGGATATSAKNMYWEKLHLHDTFYQDWDFYATTVWRCMICILVFHIPFLCGLAYIFKEIWGSGDLGIFDGFKERFEDYWELYTKHFM